MSALHQRKSSTQKTAAQPTTRRPSDAGHKKSARSASSDSSSSAESSSSSAVRSTGAPFTTKEVKQKYLARSDVPAETRTRTASTGTKETPQAKPFQSRFLSKPATVPPPSTKKDEEESQTSSEEETESEEESDEPSSKKSDEKMAKTDIGPLLARSAHARDTGTENSRKKEESPLNRSKYSTTDEPSSRYGGRRRTTTTSEEEPPRYGYTSRFLNKSKSSAAIPQDDDDYTPRYSAPTTTNDDDSKYPSGRSRYMALKDRRQRLARSRSSQQFGDEDDAEDTGVTTPISPTTSNPTAYLVSRGYGTSASAHDLSRSRSSHALKSRDNSPDRSTATTEKDGAALSSWARYLKNKYGNRSGAKDKDTGASSGSPASGSSSSAARRLSLGLPLRSSTELASSDDDQKNMQGSPTTPTVATAAAAGKFPLFGLPRTG